MKIKKYVCPICKEEYPTYQQAERCLYDCRDDSSVEEFECDIDKLCGYELDSIIGKCTTCEHSDGEGFRFADCPYKATGLQLEGCPAYAPAHDLPSVCARYNQLKEYGRLTA